jgi:hypothetical protein
LELFKRTENRDFSVASGWGKLEFTLFSLLASASLLAAYGVATFYSGVMYLAFTNLRPIFIIPTF